MRCKLCLQDKELLKKSHIIPDFMHKDLFDDNHNLIKIDLSDFTPHNTQTGTFERDILCYECDNVLLSRLEDYASKVLYGGTPVEMKNEINKEGVKWTYCRGVDYKNFKLFLLSIIWRMSISTRDHFQYVSLGPYEEKIRKMLLKGMPGKQSDFPCIISSYNHIPELGIDLISQPMKFRSENKGTGYSFLVGGLIYMYSISESSLDKSLIDTLAISESNEMRIVHMPSEQAKKILNKSIGRELFK